jgi:large subunit ribosomal protein L9
MSKELILLKDVEDLGIVGQTVKVSDGFARNYLLPKRLATPLTEAARKRLEVKRVQREAELASQLETARALSESLEGLSVTLSAKTAGERKLYGSVGVTEVLKAIQDQGFKLDRSQIHMGAPFKELGNFEVKIKLHPKIKTTIKVSIVEDKD